MGEFRYEFAQSTQQESLQYLDLLWWDNLLQLLADLTGGISPHGFQLDNSSGQLA